MISSLHLKPSLDIRTRKCSSYVMSYVVFRFHFCNKFINRNIRFFLLSSSYVLKCLLNPFLVYWHVFLYRLSRVLVFIFVWFVCTYLWSCVFPYFDLCTSYVNFKFLGKFFPVFFFNPRNSFDCYLSYPLIFTCFNTLLTFSTIDERTQSMMSVLLFEARTGRKIPPIVTRVAGLFSYIFGFKERANVD